MVTDLAYNLLSITSAAKKGKVTTYTETRCEIRDSNSKLIAHGYREGSLYYLDQGGPAHQACPSSNHNSSKEMIWHRQFGHLGTRGMQALTRNKMVSGIDLGWKQDTGFCESCVEGKSHRLPFQHSSGKRADHPLELIHSDVSGKIGTTFSPVVHFESIRSAIALGAQHKLQLHQMDVSTALLLGCRLGWRCWRQKINL